jgi:tripartite-type tricarboxylate transporter receptor subunit TctC
MTMHASTWTFAFYVLTLSVGSVEAQNYPARPVRVVVSTPAGGATDLVARAVMQRLSETWRQQIVIENKVGANTQIGAEAVARSAADGYTLLATSETTLSVNPFLYRKLSYDAKDFTPISGLGLINQVLAVHPSVPAHTVGDFISLAKAKPGQLNYGTLGIGSSSHLNTVLFESMTGVKLMPVHYKGGAPALTDLIGGHIHALFISMTLAHQPWKAGQLRVLGVGTNQRALDFPDLPTISESGVPGYRAFSWFGLFAPSGIAPEIVAKINADVQRVLLDDDFKRSFLLPNHYDPILGSAAQFAEYVKDDALKWRKVITDANISVD